jgi:hypothetical protein
VRDNRYRRWITVGPVIDVPVTPAPASRARPVSAASTVDRTVGLPIGTRVRKLGSRARFGTVMPHEPEHSRGGFPVRFDDGFWEVLDTSYVVVLAAPRRVPGESHRAS